MLKLIPYYTSLCCKEALTTKTCVHRISSLNIHEFLTKKASFKKALLTKYTHFLEGVIAK